MGREAIFTQINPLRLLFACLLSEYSRRTPGIGLEYSEVAYYGDSRRISQDLLQVDTICYLTPPTNRRRFHQHKLLTSWAENLIVVVNWKTRRRLHYTNSVWSRCLDLHLLKRKSPGYVKISWPMISCKQFERSCICHLPRTTHQLQSLCDELYNWQHSSANDLVIDSNKWWNLNNNSSSSSGSLWTQLFTILPSLAWFIQEVTLLS